MAERAEEDLLRIERHEHRIDAVDLHGAVGERAGAVVVAHRDGETEPGHMESMRTQTAAGSAAVDAGNVRPPSKLRDQLTGSSEHVADDARVPVDRLLVVLLAHVGGSPFWLTKVVTALILPSPGS